MNTGEEQRRVLPRVLLWIWGGVPGLDFVLAKLDHRRATDLWIRRPSHPYFLCKGKKNPSIHEFASERLLRLNKLKHFYLHSPNCSNSLVIRKMQMLLSDTKNQHQSHFQQPWDSQKERITKHYHTMYLHYHSRCCTL